MLLSPPESLESAWQCYREELFPLLKEGFTCAMWIRAFTKELIVGYLISQVNDIIFSKDPYHSAAILILYFVSNIGNEDKNKTHLKHNIFSSKSPISFVIWLFCMLSKSCLLLLRLELNWNETLYSLFWPSLQSYLFGAILIYEFCFQTGFFWEGIR